MRLTAALPLLLALTACARGPEPQRADTRAEVRRFAAAVAAAPAAPLPRYNLGTALLLGRRYEAARPHLQRVAADSGRVGQHAAYNLGNSHLEPVFGEQAGEQRDASLRAAIDAYKRALLLDPEDRDAKWNLELARRLLNQPPQPEPEQSRSAGGGGGGEGGGGGADSESGRQDPQPQPGGSGGPQPDLSRAAAERILAAAQERELGVQQDKLRKPQPRTSTAH